MRARCAFPPLFCPFPLDPYSTLPGPPLSALVRVAVLSNRTAVFPPLSAEVQ